MRHLHSVRVYADPEKDMVSIEPEFGGWAVAITVYRETDDTIQIYTNVYTIATYGEEDAKRYARDEAAKHFPPSDGWVNIVATKPIWWLITKDDHASTESD